MLCEINMSDSAYLTFECSLDVNLELEIVSMEARSVGLLKARWTNIIDMNDKAIDLLRQG